MDPFAYQAAFGHIIRSDDDKAASETLLDFLELIDDILDGYALLDQLASDQHEQAHRGRKRLRVDDRNVVKRSGRLGCPVVILADGIRERDMDQVVRVL